jgi:galactose mutarotase-like enzyme
MLLTLANESLRCDVALRGAELRSLSTLNDAQEFLWQRDPSIWPASAPILFPVIGRLKDNCYYYRGKRYNMPMHGFARELEFSVVSQEAGVLCLTAQDSPATRSLFPFPFRLQVTFRLHGRCLRVETEVSNLGMSVLPFSLGAHPGFRLPCEDSELADFKLVFSEREKNLVYRIDGELLACQPTPFLFDNEREILLSDQLFNSDALIFKGIRSQQIQIIHRNKGLRLCFDTGGAPDLGIWAQPGAPYVCIEPWFGYDDDSEVDGDIEKKPGIVLLAPGALFTSYYAVSI